MIVRREPGVNELLDPGGSPPYTLRRFVFEFLRIDEGEFAMSLSLILLTAAIARADAPAVTIRIDDPSRALESVLALFEGSKAPDPATALANWKRATNGKKGLGKGAEAGIAALNPAMIKELKTIAGSRFVFDFAEKDGKPSWSFTVPKDDGTFSAFATAMALTDGKSEPPLDGAEVDRLGNTPESPLMARAGTRVVIADSRQALTPALAQEFPGDETPKGSGAVHFQVVAKGLTRSSIPFVRGAGEAIEGLGSPAWGGSLVIVNHQVLALSTGPRLGTGPVATIEPLWIAELPASTSAAFSIAIDGRVESWNRVFVALDRFERADPEKRTRTSIRPRIGLAARAAGIDLERDVWPKIRGVTGFLVGDPRTPDGVAIAVHMVDDTSASAIRDRVLPKLAKNLGLQAPTGKGPGESSKPLAQVLGQTLWTSTHSSRTVWIGWGAQGIPTGLREGDKAALVDSIEARDREGFKNLSRWGWILPGKLGLVPAGSPLAEALSATAPVRWEGRDEKDQTSTDTIQWGGLNRGVRRFLELVPQESR